MFGVSSGHGPLCIGCTPPSLLPQYLFFSMISEVVSNQRALRLAHANKLAMYVYVSLHDLSNLFRPSLPTIYYVGLKDNEQEMINALVQQCDVSLRLDSHRLVFALFRCIRAPTLPEGPLYSNQKE
jgi:hypothetical protein